MLAGIFATSAASGVATQWPVSRRSVLFAAVAAPLAPLRSSAAVDCLQDCQSNCFRVAPKSGRYCLDSCAEYCDQPDRRDGLSGSISNDAAEAPLPSHASPHLPPSPRHIVPFQNNQTEVHDASTLGCRAHRAFPPAQVGWASAYDPKRFLPGQGPQGVVYGEDRPARGQMLHSHLPSSRPVARAVVTLQRSSSLRARPPRHGIAAQSPSLHCN